MPFLEGGASDDPLEQFRAWYEEASRVALMPEAAAVATVDADGRPSARMVLVKSVDERGLTFYTNRQSRKGRALAERPLAALLFYWEQLGRQVRVEGGVEQVSDDESDAYFATRPRASQVSAHASRQSEPVESRAALEATHAELAAAFGGDPIARPPSWGGYRLVPDSFEFWQNRADRLHDRLRYERRGSRWERRRLQP